MIVVLCYEVLYVVAVIVCIVLVWVVFVEYVADMHAACVHDIVWYDC